MTLPIATLLCAQPHGQGLLLTPTTTIPFTLGTLTEDPSPVRTKTQTRTATPAELAQVAHALLPHLTNHTLLTHTPTHPIHQQLLALLPPATYHPRRPSRQPLITQAQALLASYQAAQAKLAE